MPVSNVAALFNTILAAAICFQPPVTGVHVQRILFSSIPCSGAQVGSSSSRPPFIRPCRAACSDSASATLILTFNPHTSTNTHLQACTLILKRACGEVVFIELLLLPLTPITHSHVKVTYKNKLNASHSRRSHDKP